MSNMQPSEPKIPVKVVFRIGVNPLKGAISGKLAGALRSAFDDQPIYALMPYVSIANEGWRESGDMVRCYTEHRGVREEVAVEWKTIIRDTKPAENYQYGSLLQSLEEHGFEVETILATQVDHATRTMVKKDNSQPDEALFTDDSSQDVEIVAEDFTIDFDIVNDNLDAPFLDPEEWA
jgi:hypothetical protein